MIPSVGVYLFSVAILIIRDRFGNLQKYLLLHRNNFINQIDPDTREVDFQIGADLIRGQVSGDE